MMFLYKTELEKEFPFKFIQPASVTSSSQEGSHIHTFCPILTKKFAEKRVCFGAIYVLIYLNFADARAIFCFQLDIMTSIEEMLTWCSVLNILLLCLFSTIRMNCLRATAIAFCCMTRSRGHKFKKYSNAADGVVFMHTIAKHCGLCSFILDSQVMEALITAVYNQSVIFGLRPHL